MQKPIQADSVCAQYLPTQLMSCDLTHVHRKIMCGHTLSFDVTARSKGKFYFFEIRDQSVHENQTFFFGITRN